MFMLIELKNRKSGTRFLTGVERPSMCEALLSAWCDLIVQMSEDSEAWGQYADYYVSQVSFPDRRGWSADASLFGQLRPLTIE